MDQNDTWHLRQSLSNRCTPGHCGSCSVRCAESTRESLESRAGSWCAWAAATRDRV